MKKYLITLLLLPALAGAQTPSDCEKNLDACSGGSKKLSPFVQASLGERQPPAPAAALKHKAVLKAAPAPAVSSAPAAELPAERPEPARNGLSSPLWLVFVGGSLAGLYFYLQGGRRRGRRK